MIRSFQIEMRSKLFGNEMEKIIEELNEVLVA